MHRRDLIVESKDNGIPNPLINTLLETVEVIQTFRRNPSRGTDFES